MTHAAMIAAFGVTLEIEMPGGAGFTVIVFIAYFITISTDLAHLSLDLGVFGSSTLLAGDVVRGVTSKRAEIALSSARFTDRSIFTGDTQITIRRMGTCIAGFARSSVRGRSASRVARWAMISTSTTVS